MTAICFIHDGMSGYPKREAAARTTAEGHEHDGAYLCRACAVALQPAVKVVWLDDDDTHTIEDVLVLIDRWITMKQSELRPGANRKRDLAYIQALTDLRDCIKSEGPYSKGDV